MEIQRIDFYVRIDPNSKRSQGEVTSSILKKKQIIIFSVRDWTKTAKTKRCFCGVRHANRYNFFFYILYILFVDLCIVVQECMQVVNSATVIARDRRLKICSNFRSKSTKEKLEENYSTELMVLSVYLISI